MNVHIYMNGLTVLYRAHGVSLGLRLICDREP